MKRLAPMLSGTATLRAALLPVALLVCIGLLALAGCGEDENTVTFPQPWEESPYPWYYDVSGTSATDVWVVGNLGAAWHYDGEWTREDMGTGQAITCLYQASDGAMYAAGYGGKVWRESGSEWTGMSTGTSKHLYGLGSYDGALYAVGQEGTALRYTGGSWQAQPGFIVTRNPKEGNAVVDTLSLYDDVVSLKVVNHYMLGGAYLRPDLPTDNPPQGIEGTVGFYIKSDTPIVCPFPECDPAVDETGLYDWLMTTLGDDPTATPEWIISGLSSDVVGAHGDNWFGTSKGWLFRLTQDQQTQELNWIRYSLLPVTSEERYGVRDLWQAGNGDIYIVTDDGLLVHQQADGTRNTLYDQLQPLVSIWGTGPDNLYMTGYMDELILHVSHDPMDPVDPDDDVTVVTPIPLPFPDKAFATSSETDELGRPRS